MSFNALLTPPSGRRRRTLKVSRKGYCVRDRPRMLRHKRPGLTARPPRLSGGYPTEKFLGTDPEGLSSRLPGRLWAWNMGQPVSHTWTNLADTIRPYGTSGYQERGNPILMMRFRPTKCSLGTPCEKDGVTRPGNKDLSEG